jgi:hypothetical protein
MTLLKVFGADVLLEKTYTPRHFLLKVDLEGNAQGVFLKQASQKDPWVRITYNNLH